MRLKVAPGTLAWLDYSWALREMLARVVIAVELACSRSIGAESLISELALCRHSKSLPA